MLSLRPLGAPLDALSPGYRVFVYHHTHWDREWWATFQDFRFQLVERIDALLDALEADGAFRCFMLDGQNIVLKDYLEIRPEQRDRLVSLIRAGRIQCGPWYILPDEFLVSGEAHIRNLQLGAHVARQLGIANQQVGYLPDTFGHIGQMPQILSRFGIDSALVWRGVGGPPEEQRQEFLWEAPDGTRLFSYWFPDGYYLVDFLHFDNPAKTYDETFGRVRRSLELAASRATTDCILLPYGGDHRPVDSRLPRLLEAVGAELEGFALEWATLGEFLDELRAQEPELRVRRGELRAAGYGTPHLLPGVLSARMYLKRRNAACQTALERYAEPLQALSWARGARYEAGALRHAWELLIQNHPHDSICGCSIDQVHREMLARFDQSEQLAEILAERAASQLAARVDTSALASGETAIVVQNPAGFARPGLVTALLPREQQIGPRTHLLRGPHGEDVPFQARDVERLRGGSDKYLWTEIAFVADEVPALGHACYALAPREAPCDARQVFYNSALPAARLKGSDHQGDLRVGPGLIENELVRVQVEPQGTLRLTDRLSGAVYSGLNAFEDGGDAGDSYTYAAPLGDMLLRSDTAQRRVHVSVVEAGYARATLRIEVDWALPASLSEDRRSRSGEYLSATMVSYVSLAARSRRVEIVTEWENLSRDHRLRAIFPLGAGVERCDALGHFEVLRREPADMAGANGAAELPTGCFPQQGWASLSGAGRGLSVLNRGLPEAELLPEGSLALTLLRGVGWLSRDDLGTRVGHAGPLLPTPEAQCLGAQRAEYALVLHGGDWLGAQIWREFEDYAAPLRATLTERHAGELAPLAGLLRIAGQHTLLLSAAQKAEREDALLLRLWNVSAQPTAARVVPARPIRGAALVGLDEQALAPLALAADGSFELAAGGAEIVTVRVRL